MSFIEFKHIGKKYAGADKNSVSDFNLEINEKEFIAFVGPSGCGKSTTLRMVAGFEEITEGDLYIDGKKVNETAPRDRGIAMVFQNYALYPHMTVEKNIGYGLHPQTVLHKKFPPEEILRSCPPARWTPPVQFQHLQSPDWLLPVLLQDPRSAHPADFLQPLPFLFSSSDECWFRFLRKQNLSVQNLILFLLI